MNMKKYIGTKQVMAEPMNELAAVEKGFARKNKDDHEWREGYHVQYANPDGSTYNSWSPKRVFEQSYRVSETFLDRMRIEHDELNERCDKLEAFANTDKFEELEAVLQDLLISQLQAMQQYRKVLAERIEYCEEEA